MYCEGQLCGGGRRPRDLTILGLRQPRLGLPGRAFLTSSVQRQVRHRALKMGNPTHDDTTSKQQFT
jgi:hypothetical protein